MLYKFFIDISKINIYKSSDSSVTYFFNYTNYAIRFDMDITVSPLIKGILPMDFNTNETLKVPEQYLIKPDSYLRIFCLVDISDLASPKIKKISGFQRLKHPPMKIANPLSTL